MKNKYVTNHKLNTTMLSRIFILSIFSFFLWTSASAQALQDYNRFSFEVSAGLHIPVSPTTGINTGDYIGFKQIHVGARYMINTKYGVKVFFATNRFDGGDTKIHTIDGVDQEIDLYSTYTRVAIEGVFNLGDIFKMSPRFLEKNGILGHLGAGLTYSSPATVPGKVDRMGILVFGLTPQRKLTRNLVIFGDLNYVANLKQHYTYSGIRFDDQQAKIGGFMNINIGLTYYIGGNNEHADWYIGH